jgi:hypothetical protein
MRTFFRWIKTYDLFLSRFLYGGARIQDDDTPASLDMKEGGACKGPLFHGFEPLTHFYVLPPTNRHY